MTKQNALEKAVSIAGSQVRLAQLTGIKQQNISYWLLKRGGVVPAEEVRKICAAVDFRVKPEDLRPDLFTVAA